MLIHKLINTQQIIQLTSNNSSVYKLLNNFLKKVSRDPYLELQELTLLSNLGYSITTTMHVPD